MTDLTGSPDVETSKIKPVLAEDEVGRVIDLGLGRGVDATDLSPWINKSSFQVRRVTINNIIGTEEGGALQSYEHEISSVTTQQAEMKSSVTVPQGPVSIGLEAQLSRSVTKTRKVIGMKVVNRTISFRSDFEDLPQSSDDQSTATTAHDLRAEVAPFTTIDYPSDENDGGQPSKPASVGSSKIVERSAVLQSKFTFEERLSKWILERAFHRQEIRKKKAKQEGTLPPPEYHLEGNDPLVDVTAYIKQIDQEESKQILEDCYDFVRKFHITHYVSSIQLGASQYRVLSESEYYSKVSGGGTFGYEAIANLSASQSFTKKVTKKASDLRQIGKITDSKVERGSYDEAVVGIQIQPIHSLVKLRILHLALRKSLLRYIEDKQDNSAGPFVIGCGNDNIFWKVNASNGYSVEATENIQEASLFFIIPFDDSDHPYEFNIAWRGDDYKILKRSRSAILSPNPSHNTSLFRYLDARVNVLGSNEGPLYLKNELRAQHSRLTLNQRIFRKNHIPIGTKAWVQGKDQFFISCCQRRFKKDGFIAIKRLRPSQPRQGDSSGPKYITSCVPSVRYHNERFVWMLFRIYPPFIRDNPGQTEPVSADEDKIEKETERYFCAASKTSI